MLQHRMDYITATIAVIYPVLQCILQLLPLPLPKAKALDYDKDIISDYNNKRKDPIMRNYRIVRSRAFFNGTLKLIQVNTTFKMIYWPDG